MLRITIIVFLLISTSLKVQAQNEVPREILLTSLNDVAHLKFEDDKVTQLMEYNEGFVDEVYTILESEKEDKRKKESLDALSVKRKSDLHDILSKHETKKYLKYMEDELKPLVHKNKLLKHISKYN